MDHRLPSILGAGLFSSDVRFRNVRITQPRTVHTWELEYFFEEGGVSFLNGISHTVRQGHLLLAKPGDLRFSQLPVRCRYVHFLPEDPLLARELQAAPVYFGVADTRKTDAAFADIAALFCSASQMDQLAAEAAFVLLLREILEDASPASSDDTVVRAQKFIEQTYGEKLSVQTIADACSVSASYLHKLFARQKGMTPGEYLMRVRISSAREMLINTDLPLSQIAISCGFGTQSYFSECFRRHTGMTPGEFRKSVTYQL